MATTVHEPPVRSAADNGRGRGKDKDWNKVPSDGILRVGDRPSPPSTSVGIWVGLAAITMSFAAFTSALIVRQGASTDWQHFSLPPILFFNTAVLLASSLALEFGRRDVTKFMGQLREPSQPPTLLLYVTLALGSVFVAGQYVGWMQLKSQGLFLATNPSSSFFYVLTAAHALHVLGAWGGLARVIRKLGQSTLRRSTLDATSYYWHFMDVLWLYLLMLLWAKI